MKRRSETEVRVEKIEMVIKRCGDKKSLRHREEVISHLYALIFRLKEQEQTLLQTLL